MCRGPCLQKLSIVVLPIPAVPATVSFVLMSGPDEHASRDENDSTSKVRYIRVRLRLCSLGVNCEAGHCDEFWKTTQALIEILARHQIHGRTLDGIVPHTRKLWSET
jgi:hypothetical protein